MCDEYGIMFDKQIRILHKGCTFDLPEKKKTNRIIKFIYAGNLLYGRDEILSKVAKAIQKCNKDDDKAYLEIYTATTITDELKNELDIPNCSTIMGRKEYEKIKEIENDAEYVIHVESFEKENIEKVRYSFSTKIIDCMQCGSVLIGIGPQEIASIKYIKTVPGAHVIDKIEDIDNRIELLISNKNNIISDAKKIREFAIENYEISTNCKKLRDDFIKLKTSKM